MKTSTQQAVEMAKQGGWGCQDEEPNPHRCSFGHCNHCGTCDKSVLDVDESEALLDPDFWRAIGKAKGWSRQIEMCIHEHSECAEYTRPEWIDKMHTFIDHRADGDDINTALAKTLNLDQE